MLDELLRNIKHDGLEYTQQHIQIFFEQTWFIFVESLEQEPLYNKYVCDINDRQIVQDAVQTWSQYYSLT